MVFSTKISYATHINITQSIIQGHLEVMERKKEIACGGGSNNNTKTFDYDRNFMCAKMNEKKQLSFADFCLRERTSNRIKWKSEREKENGKDGHLTKVQQINCHLF